MKKAKTSHRPICRREGREIKRSVLNSKPLPGKGGTGTDDGKGGKKSIVVGLFDVGHSDVVQDI